MVESSKLFVYGTLRKGYSRHRHLADATRFLGMATIRGLLYDLGPYPGVLSSEDAEVHGELYELKDASTQLQYLDGIEGFYPDALERSLFVRRLVTVTIADQTVRAWAYLLPAVPPTARLILTGDYRKP